MQKIELNILKAVSEESRKETGNQFYKIHQGNADANTIVLFEGYKDEAAIATHRNLHITRSWL